MDYKETKIGIEHNYWWFRAKDELIKSLVNTTKEVINVGAGTCNYDYAYNFCGYANDIDKPNKIYDYAILADVLEHIDPKDRKKSLLEIRRVLKTNGKLIITVPAHQWLFNAHDRFLGHHLRYNKKELITQLKEAGFKCTKLRYWNSILFLPIVILKLLNRGKSNSDIRKTNSFINEKLYTILHREEKIEFLPFGISIVGVFENEKMSNV